MSGPGTLLANRYRLDDRIGGGGMGEVWRATDQVLGRTVAVKLMRRELVAEPGFAERFLAEARTMATIKHRGVVAIHDFHGDAAGAFLVMEHIEGESLAELLHRVRRLDPIRTMHLLAQAAEALQAAHDKGVVHRDIKPGNLLVTDDDTLVLTDFGIARSAANTALTAAGAIVGTPSYLAPEQVLGRPATARSDLYALGVVAYECLTGQRPFDGDNPFEVAMKRLREPPPSLGGGAPPAVLAVVERALAVEPEQRWASAREFAGAARHAQGSGAGSAAPTVGQAAPTPPTRRDYIAGRAALPPTPPAPPPSSHQQAAAHPQAAGHQQAAAHQPQSHPSHPPQSPPTTREEPPRRRPPAARPVTPPPRTAPRRPVAVVVAAMALGVTAVTLVIYSLATLSVLEEATAVGHDLAGDRFADYQDWVSTTLLVLTAALAAVGLAYVLLATQVFRGRRGARAWAFTLGLPLLFCCTPGWWYAQLGLAGEVENAFTVALRSRLPAWYEAVTGPIIMMGMAALLIGLIALMLPQVGRYIRRPPAYPYPPSPHHPAR